MLPLQGARVRSLVRELRAHMPRGLAKKKKESQDITVRELGLEPRSEMLTLTPRYNVVSVLSWG